MLLKRGGIESNPGPNEIVVVTSCNVRGLRSHYKRKLLFNKLHKTVKMINECHVFFLQETHFSKQDTLILDNMLKMNRIDSLGTTRQRGATICYRANDFDNILETHNDEEGRYNILIASKSELIYIFVNIYGPNDHSLQFFKKVFELIGGFCIDYPGSEIVVGGDFNLVLNAYLYSFNINQNNYEIITSDYICNWCYKLNLTDIFRALNTDKIENTWRNKNIESRLDFFSC